MDYRVIEWLEQSKRYKQNKQKQTLDKTTQFESDLIIKLKKN